MVPVFIQLRVHEGLAEKDIHVNLEPSITGIRNRVMVHHEVTFLRALRMGYALSLGS